MIRTYTLLRCQKTRIEKAKGIQHLTCYTCDQWIEIGQEVVSTTDAGSLKGKHRHKSCAEKVHLI